ncbi:MAG: beta-ketoacyl synthase N-terminal-like domain-containing protein, partial [Chloroflexota bacterium]
MIEQKAIAVVGMGAILPDAPDVTTFWQNILAKRYSIREVPAIRWNANLYFDPDPSIPDKTYSKIGGWVDNFKLDPFKMGIAIPPKVLAGMDQAQQWGIAAAYQALQHYGYPQRTLDTSRTAVILGNSLAGEEHYRSTMRIRFPEYLQALISLEDFQSLSADVQAKLINGMSANIHSQLPAITEDTMPGELANIIAGRIANVFNFGGPNFVTDAACASSLAAIESSMEGLLAYRFDAALTGGVDRSMGPESYVKFSKIGALSPDGSRPYAEGANGFVMGEGAALFLLKRLEDAEKDGDTIYAVIRGVGGSSDGKGKGITAPNPVGQQRAIERAWKNAGIPLESVGLIEGHGTSTKVGDLTEVNTLNAVFGGLNLPAAKIGLGSVKSNLGHLKSAAGAAGMLKVILALHHKIMPPTANFERPNPNIDFTHMPFYPVTESRAWDVKSGEVRRAGVSAFGFGGTNFHVVVEEYLVGKLENEKTVVPGVEIKSAAVQVQPEIARTEINLVSQTISSASSEEIKKHVLSVVSEKTGYPEDMLDLELDLEADLGIDTIKQAELFAAIRTHYGIPRREDLRLSEYNTLNKVVSFVEEGLKLTGGAPAAVKTAITIENSQKGSATHRSDALSSDALPGLSPLRGLLFLSADNAAQLAQRLTEVVERAKQGQLPPNICPQPNELAKPERLAIDYENATDLLKLAEKAQKAFEAGSSTNWSMLTSLGIYRGSGTAGKVAFLFPGQGSQYVNMLRDLRDVDPVVADTFREADQVMTPILGKPLSSYIFVDGDENAIAQAEKELRNTTITQPAVLTANVAMMRALAKYGIKPDMVIGHSLGEYAALVVAGVMTFAEALEVVSARGREMVKVSMEDNGCMAAVSAPLGDVERILNSLTGYAVIANINSPTQCVIGGNTIAVETAISAFTAAGFQATKIPVSHAFHTKIVAPASGPMRQVIARMNIQSPRMTVAANVTGQVYPNTREEIVDILAAQVASPVQFIKGIETLYALGGRVFVEVGPKRVLTTLSADILKEHNDITNTSTNHPRKGGLASLNAALCALYAAGVPAVESFVSSKQTFAAVGRSDIQPAIAAKRDVQDGRMPLTGSVVVSGAGLGLPGRNKRVFNDDNIQRL